MRVKLENLTSIVDSRSILQSLFILLEHVILQGRDNVLVSPSLLFSIVASTQEAFNKSLLYIDYKNLVEA